MRRTWLCVSSFFFQAEDGIRATSVTGVQTCALPICNAEAALGWLLHYGDRDGDGFQEYSRRSSRGIFNQGWKDSWDAIRHADGSIPQEIGRASCRERV